MQNRIRFSRSTINVTRPRNCRRVFFQPETVYFKPAGVRMQELQEVIITVDEIESIRLKDLSGMEQEEAAKKMNISQPTFHRLILSARKKISDAIVNGKAIKIEGGNYIFDRGKIGEKAMNPSGECVCPKCGNAIQHQRGIPCYKQTCPKCGTKMIR